MARCVDFPAPVGPNMIVWPMSRTWRLSQNGALPLLRQLMSAGDNAG